MKRYTVSLIWHPTLTTGVLPLLGLLYMNSHIFLTIRWSSNSAFVGKLYLIICMISDNERKIYLYISSERPGRSWADVKASKGKVNLISRWISSQHQISPNFAEPIIFRCASISTESQFHQPTAAGWKCGLVERTPKKCGFHFERL